MSQHSKPNDSKITNISARKPKIELIHSTRTSKTKYLLAIDVGFSTGMALYDQSGRLCWCGSKKFENLAQMKRFAASLIGQTPKLDWILSEGDYNLSAIWERSAIKNGVRIQRVSGHVWCQQLLDMPHDDSVQQIDPRAFEFVQKIMHYSKMSRDKKLDKHTIEAALIGLWGVLHMGWINELPEIMRHPRWEKKVAGL